MTAMLSCAARAAKRTRDLTIVELDKRAPRGLINLYLYSALPSGTGRAAGHLRLIATDASNRTTLVVHKSAGVTNNSADALLTARRFVSISDYTVSVVTEYDVADHQHVLEIEPHTKVVELPFASRWIVDLRVANVTDLTTLSTVPSEPTSYYDVALIFNAFEKSSPKFDIFEVSDLSGHTMQLKVWTEQHPALARTLRNAVNTDSDSFYICAFKALQLDLYKPPRGLSTSRHTLLAAPSDYLLQQLRAVAVQRASTAVVIDGVATVCGFMQIPFIVVCDVCSQVTAGHHAPYSCDSCARDLTPANRVPRVLVRVHAPDSRSVMAHFSEPHITQLLLPDILATYDASPDRVAQRLRTSRITGPFQRFADDSISPFVPVHIKIEPGLLADTTANVAEAATHVQPAVANSTRTPAVRDNSRAPRRAVSEPPPSAEGAPISCTPANAFLDVEAVEASSTAATPSMGGVSDDDGDLVPGLVSDNGEGWDDDE